MLCNPVVSRNHADGDFELTTPMFHEAVENFKLRSNHRIPINFDHFSHEHPNYNPKVGAPKQGNIIDMAVRADGCLWGLCDFKEPAKTYVKEGKYEDFSPEIVLDSSDRETGRNVGMRIKAVALVGDPHLYTMPQVRASNENRLTEVAEIGTKGIDSMSKELEQKIAELQNESRAKDLKISELTLEHKTALSEIQLKLDNKTKEFDELVKESVEGEVEVAFNTYKDERKLTDADKAHLRTVRLANAASFRALFPAKTVATKTTNTAVRPGYLTTNLSNENRTDVVVKLSQSDLHKKYMAEGMDNMAACLRAAKESA